MTMVKVLVNLMLIDGGGDYLPAEECEKFKSSNEKKLTGKGSREGWKQWDSSTRWSSLLFLTISIMVSLHFLPFWLKVGQDWSGSQLFGKLPQVTHCERSPGKQIHIMFGLWYCSKARWPESPPKQRQGPCVEKSLREACLLLGAILNLTSWTIGSFLPSQSVSSLARLRKPSRQWNIESCCDTWGALRLPVEKEESCTEDKSSYCHVRPTVVIWAPESVCYDCWHWRLSPWKKG